MPDQSNIQHDIDDLQERRELASRKLHNVEMQKIAETRAEEKIRQERIIQETRAERDGIDQELESLVQGLQESQAKLAPLFGVPNLPPRYLERPEYLDPFRAALLSGEVEAVGITGRPQYVGVQGMGGLGKSVLAAALAWDEQVRRAFPDGIFWLRFGQEVNEPGVLELQKEILLVLTPNSLPESPAQGRNLLNLALQGKRCLLIADDLWESRHINHFDLADSGSRFLLTTRNNEVIQETGAHRCELELLSDKQARELLTKCSGFAEEDLPEEAEDILRECNRLPLAVAGIGSMVNGKGRSRWQLALDKLQNARLDKIPAKFDRYSGYENLFKVFQVSVEDLPSEVQDYFKTLIVFPEDTAIPETVLQLYWEHGCPEDFEPLEAIDLLVRRSLLNPAGEEWFTLHDLFRDYLVVLADGKIAELHRQLLAAYQVAYPSGWHTIPHDEHVYFYRYWSFHVRAAEKMELAGIIADDLIRQQPLLNLGEVLEAVQFVDYGLKDIVPSLLKKNQDLEVIRHCLKFLRDKFRETAIRLFKGETYPGIGRRCLDILGEEAVEEVRRLLKENSDSRVIELCLQLLGNEAIEEARQLLRRNSDLTVIHFCLKILCSESKEEARELLRENSDPDIIWNCLMHLGSEAKKEAKRLIREHSDPKIIEQCLEFLGHDKKKEATRLLMEHSDPKVIKHCLDILDDEAKVEARRLIREHSDPKIIGQCLKILGTEAKEEARRLIKKNSDKEIILRCLEILGFEALEDVRRLVREHSDPRVIRFCLYLLGAEAKEEARRLIRKHSDPKVIQSCLEFFHDNENVEKQRLLKKILDPGGVEQYMKFLDTEAKEEARQLLKESSHPIVIQECLQLFGDEAKEEARRLLRNNSDPKVIRYCLENLGDEGKEEAKRLLKENSDPRTTCVCLNFLGGEAKEEAIWLLKTSEDQEIREACQQILSLP